MFISLTVLLNEVLGNISFLVTLEPVFVVGFLRFQTVDRYEAEMRQ